MWQVLRKGLDLVGVMLLMVTFAVVCLLVAAILAAMGWWLWQR